MVRLQSFAPAKVNLSLRVLGRRSDGLHELASLVAFASVGDQVTLEPGNALALKIEGAMAAAAGSEAGNLVLKAAHAFAARVEGLKLGHFTLSKQLPAGAGLGGGSSDAAAALRLLAQTNDLALDDPRLLEAADATGGDVRVCLDPRARLLQGTGDDVSPPLRFPQLAAVLVYPAIPLATADVFRAFAPDGRRRARPYAAADIPASADGILEFVAREGNDLEACASALTPAIGETRRLLQATAARAVRMSGSGSAMFGLYDHDRDATDAAHFIGRQKTTWWVTATTLN
jgi:4-diphosphocytidyl-2-C-methyl-D-erythritol kinase